MTTTKDWHCDPVWVRDPVWGTRARMPDGRICCAYGDGSWMVRADDAKKLIEPQSTGGPNARTHQRAEIEVYAAWVKTAPDQPSALKARIAQLEAELAKLKGGGQ